MTSQNYSLVRATSMMLRTLERDLIGSKIPDMIVDNLIHDLSCFGYQTHVTVIELIKDNPAQFCSKAHALWKAGRLTIVQLSHELQAGQGIPLAA